MDVFSYVRQRNSTYIHTFQHKNIQPFTREKRLGGMHSHKHFSKPMGTFWKESTVPTPLLLERAEIAQQMGDSGWFLAAQSDNSIEFGFTVFFQHCPGLQLNPLHGHIHLWEWPAKWQRKYSSGMLYKKLYKFIILTLSAQPVRPADKSTNIVRFITHLKNQGKVITLEVFSSRTCTTISRSTHVYVNIHFPPWLGFWGWPQCPSQLGALSQHHFQCSHVAAMSWPQKVGLNSASSEKLHLCSLLRSPFFLVADVISRYLNYML